MRKANVITAVALSILLVLSSVPHPSEAAGYDGKNYLLLKLGAYSPQHDDLNNFDPGFNGEIFYGRYFHKNFASELGVGYFKSNGSKQISATTLKKDEFKAVDILYTVKGVLPLGILELFAGPGVGWYSARVNSILITNGIRTALTDTNGGLGYHVLAGANFNITPKWFGGIEGKYFWAKTTDHITTVPPGFFGTHLDGAIATANVGYRF
jgi:opacity protein-like surface antigen